MNIADWVMVAAIAFSVVEAVQEGFFHIALSLAGLVVGYIVAAWQYHRLSAWFEPHLKSAWLGDIAAFLVIFVGVAFVFSIAGKLTRWMVKEVGLSAFDRALGGVLGLLRAGLLVAVVLVGMASFAPTAQWLQGSELAPYFLVAGRAAVWLAPAELRSRFHQGLQLLKDQSHSEGSPKPESH